MEKYYGIRYGDFNWSVILKYEPDLNRKNTRKRIEQAITWAEQFIDKTKPNWLSTRYIDDNLGSQSRPLGKWLRQQILICVDEHWNWQTAKCKKYIRNDVGIKELKKRLNYTPVKQVTKEEEQQLATGEFEYEEKSNRYFNSIQYKPRYVKRPLLAHWGYNYNYDIACAAPRLILQYARKCGLTKETPLMDRYINDTAAMRQELADELSLTPDQVKLVINTILNGGHISHKEDTSLFVQLGRSHIYIDRLQASSTIDLIKKEIKSMWSAIKPHRTLTSARITPKDKSDVYRELEQVVIKSVRTYLNKTKNKGLLEHDGWTTCEAIDITELRTYVRSTTGYDIEVVWEVYE